MQQVAILVGNRVIVSGFVDGTRVVELKHRETDADALAHALWLSKHRNAELADEYLDWYIQRKSGITRH